MSSAYKIATGVLVVLLLSSMLVAQKVVGDSPTVKAADGPGKPPDSAPSVFDASVDPKNDPQLQEREERYKVAPGDSFDVNFELSPEFNQSSVTIQPDGFVTLRSVGEVYVQGQSLPELTETLRGVYGKILNDPLISVNLKDFEKPYFVADGQVGRPGKYDLRGEVTLTQAVAIAGGFNQNAKASQVLLFRRVSDQWMEAKLIDVKKMHKSGNLREDPTIRPGDMLFVPKTTLSKIDRFFPSAQMGTMFKPN